MSKIVIDLQRNALDPNVEILTLLRQAYLISRKLKLADFENWVQNELGGYKEGRIVPKYREIWGELKAWNPMRGWIPVLIPNDSIHETICKSKIRNSIPNILSILKADEGIRLPFHGEMAAMFAEGTGQPTLYELDIPINAVEEIVEIVRTNILEWSLLLEENGILGEGLEFSLNEKEQAKQANIVNYVNHFYAAVHNTQLQQGTLSSEQSK